MEYDITLQHKPGKTMIPADALSRRHDHAQNVEDTEDQIGLSDRLFVNLLDIELQNAVAKGQLEDSTAQEALNRLNDPENQTTKWHLEKGPNGKTCLFTMARCMSQMISNYDDESFRIITTHR